ncbi:MAG: hypothetical protein NTV88_04600 [Candidatus Micrarchaeota archaeon]|nr:hypothetical protein [Candidatus Micrarchaeota archaeon]
MVEETTIGMMLEEEDSGPMAPQEPRPYFLLSPAAYIGMAGAKEKRIEKEPGGGADRGATGGGADV